MLRAFILFQVAQAASSVVAEASCTDQPVIFGASSCGASAAGSSRLQRRLRRSAVGSGTSVCSAWGLAGLPAPLRRPGSSPRPACSGDGSRAARASRTSCGTRSVNSLPEDRLPSACRPSPANRWAAGPWRREACRRPASRRPSAWCRRPASRCGLRRRRRARPGASGRAHSRDWRQAPCSAPRGHRQCGCSFSKVTDWAT